MKVSTGLPGSSTRAPYGPAGPVVPLLAMLPPASGLPLVARTCRPENVSTHGDVEALVIVAVAVLVVTESEAVRPVQPAPPAETEPVAARNANPAGAVMMIVPPLARSPELPSVMTGPVSVVNVPLFAVSADTSPPNAGDVSDAAALTVASGTRLPNRTSVRLAATRRARRGLATVGGIPSPPLSGGRCWARVRRRSMDDSTSALRRPCPRCDRQTHETPFRLRRPPPRSRSGDLPSVTRRDPVGE